MEDADRNRRRLLELVEDGSVEDMASFLKDHQIGLQGSTDRSPLLTACQLKRGDVVEMLLQHGASPDGGRDGNGRTPLHCACDYDSWNSKIVRSLLGAGASVDTPDHNGMTALHHASAHNHVEVVSLLLAYYADTDREDDKGETPLCKTNSVAVATLLMNAGSGVDTNFGQPLLSAVENGHLEVADLLIKAGANLNYHPLVDVAKSKRYHRIVHLLSKAGLSIKAKFKTKGKSKRYRHSRRKKAAQSREDGSGCSNVDNCITMPLNVLRMRETGSVNAQTLKNAIH